MPPTDGYTLPKGERLCGKKAVSLLIEKGRWGATEHIRYCALKTPGGESTGNRMMVSVSKKFFKRAVRRNLLKRRMREAYRLNKSILPADGGIDVLFSYSKKEIADFSVIEKEIRHILEHLA